MASDTGSGTEWVILTVRILKGPMPKEDPTWKVRRSMAARVRASSNRLFRMPVAKGDA